MSAEERRLAAILFSDICGYSRIMGADEKQALAIVGMHNSCIESAAEVHSGRIIKKMGDGVLVEFPSAVNAVQAAVAIQKAITEHNTTAGEKDKFHVRIGIHVGDVVVTDGGDLFGDGVNVASRIQPLAEPGGICVSRDIFDLVNNKMEMQAVNLGPHDLRNISRQIDIYEILVDAVARSKKSSRPAVKALRNKRIITISAVVAGVILLLCLLAVARKASFKNAARRNYIQTTELVKSQVEKGDFAGALNSLNAYPADYSKTEWQAKIDEEKPRVQELMRNDILTKRQIALLKAVYNDDKQTALEILDPDVLKRANDEMLWLRMKTITGVMKLAHIAPSDFKVESIEFTGDTKATVFMKVFVKTAENPEGQWNKAAPMKWLLVDKTWYFAPDPPRPVQDRPGFDQQENRRDNRIIKPGLKPQSRQP